MRGLERGKTIAWCVGALWCAAIVLALNDHGLKPSGAAPALAGKLSDIAGLIAAPAVLAALLRAGTRLQGERAARLAALLVGAFFCALQLSAGFAHGFDAIYAVSLAPIGLRALASVPDLADLLTLPALFIGYRLARALPSRSASTRVALCASALACTATSASSAIVEEHWGFLPAEGDVVISAFEGGTLVAQMGKQSREGSFEVGLVLHATTHVLTLDPAAVEAELAGKRVLPPPACASGAISAQPKSAASTRTCFVVTTRDSSKPGEQKPQSGTLHVPVHVQSGAQDRVHVVDLPMTFRAREHATDAWGRFHK